MQALRSRLSCRDGPDSNFFEHKVLTAVEQCIRRQSESERGTGGGCRPRVLNYEGALQDADLIVSRDPCARAGLSQAPPEACETRRWRRGGRTLAGLELGHEGV